VVCFFFIHKSFPEVLCQETTEYSEEQHQKFPEISFPGFPCPSGRRVSFVVCMVMNFHNRSCLFKFMGKEDKLFFVVAGRTAEEYSLCVLCVFFLSVLCG
jgi:hypothetical protein